MTFSLTFKTPDVLDQLKDEFTTYNEDTDERESTEEDSEKLAEAIAFAEKYLDCSEYITIEFDTEKGTAVAK